MLVRKFINVISYICLRKTISREKTVLYYFRNNFFLCIMLFYCECVYDKINLNYFSLGKQTKIVYDILISAFRSSSLGLELSLFKYSTYFGSFTDRKN